MGHDFQHETKVWLALESSDAPVAAVEKALAGVVGGYRRGRAAGGIVACASARATTERSGSLQQRILDAR